MTSQLVASTLFLLLGFLTHTAGAQSACHPESWQADIDKIIAEDRAHPPAPGSVVFVGSSSIRMWDLQKFFPNETFLNRGFGGSELCDSTHYFDQLVAKHQPRLVVLYAGDNDIAQGKSATEVHTDFLAFEKKFTSTLPAAKLIYISIKPSRARWQFASAMRQANSLIAETCAANKRFTFVDVWTVMLDDDGQPREECFLEDGLHMNEAGYSLWTELLKPILQQVN